MYRIAVCEDETENLQEVLTQLSDCFGDTFQVDVYREASDLLDEWGQAGRQLQDILLMDIRFKDVDGLSVVRKLQKSFGQLYVIFMTGYAEYAEQAFETEPVHYLIKPVTRERLRMAVDKAVARLRQNEETMLAIPVKDGIVRLLPREISYIESNLRVLEIHGQQEQIWTVRMKLEELMKKLPEQFVRVHQSFVVNLSHVTAFRGHDMELVGGTRIPVSRARYGEAKERFWAYLRSKV